MLSASPAKSDQDTEYEIVLRITRQLKDGFDKRHENFSEFMSSLHRNRELWSTFSVDVLSDGNKLSPDLKAGILYLSEFIRTYSSRVIREELSIDPLIEVNLSVLRGLSNKGKTA
jgi:flagellar protein FlaF